MVGQRYRKSIHRRSVHHKVLKAFSMFKGVSSYSNSKVILDIFFVCLSVHRSVCLLLSDFFWKYWRTQLRSNDLVLYLDSFYIHLLTRIAQVQRSFLFVVQFFRSFCSDFPRSECFCRPEIELGNWPWKSDVRGETTTQV